MTVQYKGADIPVELSSTSNTLNFIQEHIIPDLLRDDPTLQEKIIFNKISKNSSIEKVVDRLCQKDSENHFICIYSYGPHLQKLLSIVEIFKKVKTEKDNVKINQWTKMAMFKTVEEGRNELLEKKTIVPILITFITVSASLTSPVFENDQNMFTNQ
ncbi:similar to Saccharomyces cerevisiae YGR030C POP6 Subunit of both RNase MRP and nuclear RNase P [Maudiozyma barnettii]|uniref:Similar to Saccharomyces cerevisiae YGR030C POP6 Subunit of both RNase MRP and nuclear RNase P n=1 Tax=Maudiozyma barnettii TaxID=61262 RepID=A0A8H2ZM61_9SACH|nr:ribonuclease P/MRP protein subunit POP6 [Kazachstania barnettii]CAB4256777.1 similar to Saccharomyces cerevisiae YGR030C POP6 Subunit of both RNase MRP and nuclear RNase P [Kazachstania barnettii]CAD1785430.1 similar to Saccharomyces cerevisiae YGR030C POP6 Subunit of both RNase MRP and nuclear RNase P [Kazachstania barnettii]